ncbi:MAG: MFS transporter [Anaerolineae bacterium]|nr:MFS transporter [Anaerolineae bacterium]
MKAKDYIAINVYWFGLAFLWNALHPIVLPALLVRYVPGNLKNTALGAMIFVGLFLAMVIQPIAGALSDQTRTRWGKRRPWMLIGTLGSLVFLLLMALSGSLWMLVAGYLLLQLASNAAHGPAQGLIPDLVPAEHRGLASGVKNLFDMGGLVVTSLVAGQLMQDDNPGLAFGWIMAVLAVSTLITLLGAPEKQLTTGSSGDNRHNDLRHIFRIGIGSYPAYRQLLFSRFMVLLGIYIVQSFAQYYIQDWLNIPDAAAVTGNLMAAIGIALTLLVFPAGWLSDRIGRKRLNVAAGGLAAVGLALLVFANHVTALYLFGAIIGIATGTFLSVNWAFATDLIPGDQAGKYLGLSNLATAGAGATSRLAGPLIDGLNAILPGRFIGYPSVFLLAAACTLTGTVLLSRISENKEN